VTFERTGANYNAPAFACTHRAARARLPLTIGRVEPPCTIHDDIARASTPDRAFCRDDAAREAVRERVFARTWHWLGDLADVVQAGALAPRNLLPGLIDEPLLLARDHGVPRLPCECSRAPAPRTSP